VLARCESGKGEVDRQGGHKSGQTETDKNLSSWGAGVRARSCWEPFRGEIEGRGREMAPEAEVFCRTVVRCRLLSSVRQNGILPSCWVSDLQAAVSRVLFPYPVKTAHTRSRQRRCGFRVEMRSPVVRDGHVLAESDAVRPDEATQGGRLDLRWRNLIRSFCCGNSVWAGLSPFAPRK
jgi:hypothetical protein